MSKLLLQLLTILVTVFCCGCTEIKIHSSLGRERAPAFELRGIDGAMHALEDYRGTPVLVHFWAPSCTTCGPELRALDELQREMKDRLIVLAIGGFASASEIKRYASDHSLTLPVLIDERKTVLVRYGVHLLPMTFVVDAKGFYVPLEDPNGGDKSDRFKGPRGWNSERVVQSIERLSAGSRF